MTPAAATLIMAAFLLTGCVLDTASSGSVALDLDEMEAHKVRQLFGTHCVFKRVRGTLEKSYVTQATEVSVYAIEGRMDGPVAGWKQADITYRGHRDMIFFNPDTGEYVCGSELWRDYRNNARLTPLPKSPIIKP